MDGGRAEKELIDNSGRGHRNQSGWGLFYFNTCNILTDMDLLV
jgi:hypothetical protein